MASSGDRTPSIAQSAVQRLGRSRVREILFERNISPKKAMGQNFLIDPNVAEKMCRIAGVRGSDCVLEIGPGVGSLTAALAASGALVLAVEKDKALARVVRTTVPEALVVCGDVFEADVIEAARCQLQSEQESALRTQHYKVLGAFVSSSKWKLVSNLPYSVGTSVLLHLLFTCPKIQSGAVMLQLEVAERLCAEDMCRSSSAATLMLSYEAVARIAAKVPPHVFYPRPHVLSAILKFERRNEPPVQAPKDLLFALVREAFSSRRKMLKNSLAKLKWFSTSGTAVQIFSAAGVQPSCRAEEVGLAGFAALARAVSEFDPRWEESLSCTDFDKDDQRAAFPVADRSR